MTLDELRKQIGDIRDLILMGATEDVFDARTATKLTISLGRIHTEFKVQAQGRLDAPVVPPQTKPDDYPEIKAAVQAGYKKHQRRIRDRARRERTSIPVTPPEM